MEQNVFRMVSPGSSRGCCACHEPYRHCTLGHHRETLGQPICRLLGGDRGRVPAYAAGGYYAPGKTIEDLQKEMAGYIEMGYDTVKMKVGRLELKKNAERVKAVRAAIGPDIRLMVDGNHAWTAYQAIQFGRMIEKYEPYWLEEPVPTSDYAGGTEVRAALDIPLATGENGYLRWGFRDLIEHRAVDIVQADPNICGGYTEWRKLAAIATAHNLLLAPHGHGNLGAHAVASIHEGLTVETYPTHNLPSNDIVELFSHRGRPHNPASETRARAGRESRRHRETQA